MMLKMAVLAPIPRARDITAMAVKNGRARRVRQTNRQSDPRLCTVYCLTQESAVTWRTTLTVGRFLIVKLREAHCNKAVRVDKIFQLTFCTAGDCCAAENNAAAAISTDTAITSTFERIIRGPPYFPQQHGHQINE